MKTAKPLVMVVDDKEALRMMLRCFLGSSGFRVLTAPTGEHALRICQRIKKPIEAMITDVHMPEMSGFELAVKAAQIRPEMAVVFMSGAFSESDSEIRNRLSPRTTFLAKPFDSIALSSKLRLVLGPAHLAADLRW